MKIIKIINGIIDFCKLIISQGKTMITTSNTYKNNKKEEVTPELLRTIYKDLNDNYRVTYDDEIFKDVKSIYKKYPDLKE